MGNKCCRPDVDEIADIDSKKGLRPSKNKKSKKDDKSPADMSMPGGSTEADDINDDQEEMAQDLGAAENLMEKGKKISLDDFQLMKVIGRGSFGKVYLVKHKEEQKPYALKILKKDQLIKKNLLIKTQAERDILEKIKNPYIVGLHFAFQTETKLYFVIDFLNGGELFTYLRKESRFAEQKAKIYTAEMIDAIGCLHSNGIIYRDLKPENVLLDAEGHIRITDFGLSKQGINFGDKTHSFCGTPEYLAPEIITGSGHGRGADWWSLGALLYEMLSGRPPHYSRNRNQMLQDISNKKVEMKPYFSPEVSNLLSKLLERNPDKRIGCTETDADEIRAHPWFSDINWEKVSTMTHEAIFKPKVKGAEDVSCIDKLFTKEGLQETLVDPSALTNKEKQAAHFQGFTYQDQGELQK